MIKQTRRKMMSNQSKFNTKAIELTHDELVLVTGGRKSAGGGNGASNSELTAAFEAQTAVTKAAALQGAKAETEAAKLQGDKKAADAYKALLQ
jgi:hypothetical protein